MIVTKEMMIKKIAENEDIDVATTRKVINAIWNIIFDYLSSTTPNNNTIIKLFEGLSLECRYIPEKETLHPKTNERIISPAKIWSKAKITRCFNRKLNKIHNTK